MTSWKPLACAVATLALSATASAQFKNADDAIEYRQGALVVMAHHFGHIGAMASGKLPFDAKAAESDAELFATLARLPWTAFVDGSDKGDTSARPEIWAQPDKFKADVQRLQDAAARLVEATRMGRQDAVKAAFSATGDACKGCHDDFRKKH
jgi:cytochrome c556